MGCVQSTKQNRSQEEEKTLTGAVFVFVPPVRVPCRSTEMAKGLRSSIVSESIIEHMIALRTRIETMAMGDDTKPGFSRKKNRSTITYHHQHLQPFPPTHGATMVSDLQLAIEEYLPFLLGLANKDSKAREALAFSWIDHDNHQKETQIADAHYELLSLLHLMAILTLSQANLLLTPDPVHGGYQARVTDENKRASLDAFLKASGILNCTFDSVMTQMSEDLLEKLPPNLSKDTLTALYMQVLAQGVEIQLNFAIDNPKATLAVKRRLACEQLKCWEQAKSKLPKSSYEDGYTWGQKHNLFIDWKHAEAKATAYYFHGLILCEKAEEGLSADAACCLQLADSLLTDSKKLCAKFCSTSPASRVPPLTGSMKFLSERIPKDASTKSHVQNNKNNRAPELPDFAIALQPEDYILPSADAAWSSVNGTYP